MTAIERLDQIEARAKVAADHADFDSWHPPLEAFLSANDSAEDVPALVAALRAVLALDMGHSANNPHAYCISPLALRRAIEEALS